MSNVGTRLRMIMTTRLMMRMTTTTLMKRRRRRRTGRGGDEDDGKEGQGTEGAIGKHRKSERGVQGPKDTRFRDLRGRSPETWPSK
jgi:hypothetical protein